jgi:protein SCO1/2
MLVPVAVMLGAVTAHLWLKPSASLQSGTLLPAPREISDFRLVAENGQPFTPADFQGRWSLLFTGFTRCPDVCPTTLNTLRNVAARLGADGTRLQVVFLSIDPERDTPETLAGYVRYFNPQFRGVTGPNAELDRLAASMGFAYVKVPGRTAESYTMDHSTALMLVDPSGRLAAYFTPPLSIEALTADLSMMLRS